MKIYKHPAFAIILSAITAICLGIMLHVVLLHYDNKSSEQYDINIGDKYEILFTKKYQDSSNPFLEGFVVEVFDIKDEWIQYGNKYEHLPNMIHSCKISEFKEYIIRKIE